MREMPLVEAVREIADKVASSPEAQFAFFLGAGCSVSSGIPAADGLVRKWLPRLKRRKTGTEQEWEIWAKSSWTQASHSFAGIYKEVITELFRSPVERQEEIEQIVDVRTPIGFGYVTLATLMTHSTVGDRFNVILTTNFDDLVADALFLYTDRKPRVIGHESLSRFIRKSRYRPLILKLHGDAHLAPLNVSHETQQLPSDLAEAAVGLLKNRGLIFSGYGGNDVGVAKALDALRSDELPYGIYWINNQGPGAALESWLEAREGVWIRHRDFDQVMAVFFEQFKLDGPDLRRHETIKDDYDRARNALISGKGSAPQAVVAAIKAVEGTPDWWLGYGKRASELTGSAPDEAEKIYAEGVARLPRSAPLLINFAFFLEKTRRDFDRADEFYRRALEADPKNAANLGYYAFFLQSIRDFDRAEVFYQRALEVDPKNAANLGRYSFFLRDTRRDLDRAVQFYRRAVAADPRQEANISGGHGVVIAGEAESPKRVGEKLNCRVTVGHGDFFGDTIAILDAFDLVDPLGKKIRIPPSGHLEIVDKFGNTNATRGGTLPVHIGPSGSILQGLPGDPNPGLVVFSQSLYIISNDDARPVLSTESNVLVVDLCDDPDTVGCSSRPYHVQFTCDIAIID